MKALYLILLFVLPIAHASRQDLDPSTVEYYKDLVTRYKKSPSSVRLSDFSETFLPMDKAPDESSDMSLICNNGKYQGHCAPDTYYSWGPIEKVNSVKAATTGKWTAPLNGNRRIFMSYTPLASWCYGNHLLRFKLKSPPKAGPLLYSEYNLKEWTITTSREVESVSFAQPEHIDEIVAEYKRRLEGENYFKVSLYAPSLQSGYPGEKSIINGCVPEVLELDEKNLVKNLIILLDSYFEGKGWLHTIDPRSDHFETKWPTFFNPI